MVSSNKRDKLALKTTCIKNVNFKLIKIRIGCQYIGYSATPKTKLGGTKPSTRLHAAHGLDMADLV